MVILISGTQGSGKTTLQNNLSKALHQQYNIRVKKINFADIIYQIHDYAINVLKGLGIFDDRAKDGYLLQLLGTEWGRKTRGENIWVDCLKARIKQEEAQLGETTFIIGDARFENEVDLFPDALKIRLECDRDLRKERCSMWRDTEDHPSETGLDSYSAKGKFDLKINTGSCSKEETLIVVLNRIMKLKEEQDV